MSPVNWKRVLIGGVAAGIVVFLFDFISFGFVFNSAMNAAYAALGKDFEAGGPLNFVAFIATSLMVGIVAVWLYAAIRPRYGAGPRTALIAGFVVWLLAYLFADLGAITMLFPSSIVATSIGLGLVESVVAAQVGAYLYRE